MSAPIRVLHVDDDPRFGEVTARFLRREDGRFDVVAETRVADALDRLSDSSGGFDCVVSDYALPETDGLDFLAAVRADYPDLPFILFTGRGSEEVARDALTGGATDYLQKQSGTEQWGLLANRIENAVEQYRDKQERERGERYRRRLYEITSDTGLGIAEKTTRLLELGCERLGVENGHVARIERDTGRHEIRTAAGSEFVQADTVTDLEETYCRRTITADDILAVYNATEAGWEEDPAYRRWGIGCYIGGRITVGDELYGTLCFVDREPRDRGFTGAERGFVDLVTRWLSHMFERREHKRELREYELVFDTVPDGVFVLDSESEFAMVNDAMTAITGYDRGDLIGTPASRLFDAESVATGPPGVGRLETGVSTAGGDTVLCELRGAVLAASGADSGRRTVGVLREVSPDPTREPRGAVRESESGPN